MRKFKMMSKNAVLFAAGTILVAGFLTGCGAEKIQVDEYISVYYHGVSGRATAQVVDAELREAVEEAVRKNAKGDDDWRQMASDAMDACILTLDKTENLSNGDEVVVSADINNDLSKAAKVKFEFKGYSETIEGLKEVPTYTDEDLFAVLDVSFKGISPDAELVVERNTENENLQDLEFSTDTTTGLKKGQEIVITCRAHDNNSYLVDPNATLQKSYVVDGVGEYLLSADQVTEEVISVLKPEADENAKPALENAHGNTVNLFLHEEQWSKYFKIDAQPEARLSKVLCMTLKPTAELGSNRIYNYVTFVYNFDFTGKTAFNETRTFTNAVMSLTKENVAFNVDGKVIVEDTRGMSKSDCFESYEDWYKAFSRQYGDKYDIVEISVGE